MLKVVYVDVLFGINFIINYLILFASAKLCTARIRRLLIALAALVGAVYCCAAYFSDMNFLWALAAKLAAGAVMIIIAFGITPSFIKLFLSFCGVSFAFGGCVLAVLYMTGGVGAVSMRNGVYYISVPFGVLAAATIVCFTLINLVFKRTVVSHGKRISQICVADQKGSVSFQGLVDTGNNLTDPITNQPVIIAEYQTLKELFPEEITQVLDGINPSEFPLAIDRLPREYKFRLLPYKTVSSQLDMLLVFKPKQVSVDGEKISGGFVAISPYPISDGGAYNAIVGVAA